MKYTKNERIDVYKRQPLKDEQGDLLLALRQMKLVCRSAHPVRLRVLASSLLRWACNPLVSREQLGNVLFAQEKDGNAQCGDDDQGHLKKVLVGEGQDLSLIHI